VSLRPRLVSNKFFLMPIPGTIVHRHQLYSQGVWIQTNEDWISKGLPYIQFYRRTRIT